MSQNVSESTIVENIVRYLRSLPNAHARKIHGSVYGTTGEPDIDACMEGRTLKIEVKRPGYEDQLKPIQRVALQRWRDAGAIVGVATSVDDVRELIYWSAMNDPASAFPVGVHPTIVTRTDRLLAPSPTKRTSLPGPVEGPAHDQTGRETR